MADKILKFNDFLLENIKYGEFDGSVKYTNWSDFKSKLDLAISKGFSTPEELVTLMGMDQNLYDKIVESMIYN